KAAARLGIAWLNRAEPLLPPTRALYARRADFWNIIGDEAKVKDDAQRAEAIEPKSPVDRFWHGYAEQMRGEKANGAGDSDAAKESYRQALAEYAAVLRERPQHFWAYLQWASCHVTLDDPVDALVGFSECIHLKPDRPAPYHNRALAHYQLKQWDEVIEDE